MAPMLNRRGAIAGFGGLAALWAVPVVAQAQQAVLAWTPKGLTPDLARTLQAACDRIVPNTGAPGAVAAGVPQFIDRNLVDWAEPADADRIRAGLASLDVEAQGKFGRPYALLLVADQDALLARADAEWRNQPPGAPMHWFPMLRELVTSSYFTSEIGATKALRYDPVPGAFRGCVPVREIGRTWAL
jgi:hypothetical protein